MPINILMPALSPTMETGNLVKWLKKEGDAVKAGDVLAEIETDKATMEIEAADEGTLTAILVAEGTDNIKVNTPIAQISGEGISETEAPGDQRANGSVQPEAHEPAMTVAPEPSVAAPVEVPLPDADLPAGTEMATITVIVCHVARYSSRAWRLAPPPTIEFSTPIALSR